PAVGRTSRDTARLGTRSRGGAGERLVSMRAPAITSSSTDTDATAHVTIPLGVSRGTVVPLGAASGPAGLVVRGAAPGSGPGGGVPLADGGGGGAGGGGAGSGIASGPRAAGWAHLPCRRPHPLTSPPVPA